MIVLAACRLIDKALVYVVHPLRKRRCVLRSNDTDGVFTDLAAHCTPRHGWQPCLQLSGAVSVEAWQIFICTLQSVGYEPFEDLSL